MFDNPEPGSWSTIESLILIPELNWSWNIDHQGTRDFPEASDSWPFSYLKFWNWTVQFFPFSLFANCIDVANCLLPLFTLWFVNAESRCSVIGWLSALSAEKPQNKQNTRNHFNIFFYSFSVPIWDELEVNLVRHHQELGVLPDSVLVFKQVRPKKALVFVFTKKIIWKNF